MDSQLGARMVYENAKQALVEVGGLTHEQVENAVLSQGYLRLEQLLTNTQTQFKFPILNNQTTGSNTIRATEKRLNLQDVFYCSEIGIYLSKAGSATATNLPLYTYPSTGVFTTGAASLYTFYNGLVKITINNSVIVPALDVLRFLTIPQTQFTAATNSPIDEFHGMGDLSVQMPVEPNLLFIGTKNSEIEIDLPGIITTIDANTYAIIELRGVLAQNVTIVS